MTFKTHALINLDNLAYNIHCIKNLVAPSKVIAVVKADAYGHGAAPVARRLVKEGVGMFAVAQLQEALELKESGIDKPILVLGRLFPDEIPHAIKAGFRITVFGAEDLSWIEKARQELPAVVHVKAETGMGRMGLHFHDAPGVFDALVKSGACRWEGLFSHFSTADEKDKTYSNIQLSRFGQFLSLVRKSVNGPRLIHMASSGGILDIPASHFDAVRPGILMYGHYPSLETSHSVEPRQVMTLKTVVAHLREMPAGHPISYGRRWTPQKDTRIAVLPTGYADGLSRRLTNKGEVLIRGRRYPMVGTVTMDYTMVDVGGDPIEVGDEVVVWGESSQGVIQAWEVAEKLSTIPYELTCAVSKRVKRVYVGSV